MPRVRNLAIGCAALLFGVATEAGLPSAGVFVYSSLCMRPEDPGGAQIVLVRGAAGNMAIFSRTEGPIMAPVLAYGPDVKIDERSGHVSLRFVDPEFGKDGIFQFEGTVSDDALDIVSQGWLGHLHLPRIPSVPGKLPRCGK